MEEQLYYGKTLKEIQDRKLTLAYEIESGQPYWVTPEQREALKRAWDACVPKVEGLKGKIVVFGTGGNMKEDNKDLKELFYNPSNYGFVEKRTQEDKENVFFRAYDIISKEDGLSSKED